MFKVVRLDIQILYFLTSDLPLQYNPYLRPDPVMRSGVSVKIHPHYHIIYVRTDICFI